MDKKLGVGRDHWYKIMGEAFHYFAEAEVERRLKDGSLIQADLPVLVNQIFIRTRVKDGIFSVSVSLNDEPQFTFVLPDGQQIDANDLEAVKLVRDHEFLHLDLDEENGEKMILHVYLSMYSFFMYYNFGDSSHPASFDLNYWIGILELKTFDVAEKAKIMSEKNWPPAPGFNVGILMSKHDALRAGTDDNIQFILEQGLYNEQNWPIRIKLWEAEELFFGREKYIAASIERYLADDYISSIYTIVPQVEGTIYDYLSSVGVQPNSQFKLMVAQLKELVLGRKIIWIDRDTLDVMFDFISSGSFWRNTSQIPDPSLEINRHGIAHGKFKNFENKRIAFKWLLLIDSLSTILMHERVVRNNFISGLRLSLSDEQKVFIKETIQK